MLAASLNFTSVLAADPKPAADAKQPADTKIRIADRKPLSQVDEAALAGHFREAFDEGYIVGPRRLQEAQKRLADARRLAPGDPRVDYATGLVLMKQGQVKPAAAQFEAALQRDGAAYWPAWQAVIWAHLSDKQYEPGLSRLDEFAAIVRNAEQPDDVSEAQREAARWIGQLFEAVSRLPESRKFDDLLVEHQVKVLDTFGERLSLSLDEGRELVRARQFELDQAAGAARMSADRKKALRDQDKSAQIEKGLDGAGKQKEDAKKTEQDWKKWLDDLLAASDKQLAALDRDYKYLDQRAKSLFQSYTLAGTQLTALNFSLSAPTRYTTAFVMQTMQQQSLAVQNQMIGYQFEYNATSGRMADVAQRGAQAMQERADGIKRYEDATGQLVKKQADLDKWSARLTAEKQKLAAPKPAGKKGTADKKQPYSLKTMLPFNLEYERDQLLGSFGILSEK